MDWDQDGETDVLSGSWPGEVYFFRRQPDGRFAAGEVLKDAQGEPINVGSAAAAHAVDWNDDGLLDLLVGVIDGNVYFLPRQRTENSLPLGPPQRLELKIPAEHALHDAAPVAADWNADGRLDLLVGADDGSVWFFRNDSDGPAPALADGEQLIPQSPLGWSGDQGRLEGDWGRRVKLCPVDFNGDGQLDLLMGDYCGGYEGKPPQTAQELVEEQASLRQLPELRRQWSKAFAAYRRARGEADPSDTAQKQELAALRDEVTRLKDEIARCQAIQQRYEPQRQTHGFVWLWLRQGDQEPPD